jgi:hypothetical protein
MKIKIVRRNGLFHIPKLARYIPQQIKGRQVMIEENLFLSLCFNFKGY